MPQTGIHYLTYQEMMEKTNNLKTPFGLIGRELDDSEEFINDLPLVPASDQDYDLGSFYENWKKDKHSSLADFQSPYFSSTFDDYSRKDFMFLRKSAITMKRNDFRKSETDMEAYRWEATQITIKDIIKDCADDFVHGNPEKDSRHALGLEARFNMITDMEGIVKSGAYTGKVNPYITLDAGGTSAKNGKLTSVYLLIPSTSGVCRIYPSKGSFVGGIQYKPGVWFDAEEQDPVSGNTGYIQKRVDYLDICTGLSFRNRRAGIRIANIDYSTEEGIKNFIYKYYEAVEAIKDCSVKGTPILYANRKMRVELKKYFNDRKYPTSISVAKPEEVMNMRFTIDGEIPIKPNEHIQTTENAIA